MDFYGDNDPSACAWLRELMQAGLIPEGKVDERDIQKLQPADLQNYRQVHLFAGIAGWSLALQLAEWPADRPVWTASCPCPPFSAAGKKKSCPACGGRPVPCPRRTGYFICLECEHAWHADGRHLWPEVWRLIRDCRPATVFGEQVSGHDGLVWFAGVRASLEKIGYRVGAADLPAASVGAPHIRQRIFWMADAERSQRRQAGSTGVYDHNRTEARRPQGAGRLEFRSANGGMADTSSTGVRASGHGQADGAQRGNQGTGNKRERIRPDTGNGGSSGGLGDTRSKRHRDTKSRPVQERPGDTRPDTIGQLPDGPARSSSPGRMGDTSPAGLPPSQCEELPGTERHDQGGTVGQPSRSFWSDSILIPCRDGKARRIPRCPQPGIQFVADGLPLDMGSMWVEGNEVIHPLAQKVEGRVGLLRVAGNAIVPQVAAMFIRAFLDTEESEK